MDGFSISFTLGKASAPHGANIDHNNRYYIADNVLIENTEKNITYKEEDIEDAYHLLFDDALEKYNKGVSRKCRQIENYYEHIKNSKREEHFYEAVIQFGNVENTSCSSERGAVAKQMLDEYMKNFEKRNPNLHVFNAVLHLDEASPHLHIDFIPFYFKNRKNGLSKGVSMKAALDEQGFTASSKKLNRLVAWELSERNAMEKILKSHGLSRVEMNAHYKHKTVEEFKIMKDEKVISAALEKHSFISKDIINEKTILGLQMQIDNMKMENQKLKEEKFSQMKSFFYSDSDKQSYIMEMMDRNNFPYVETEFGFNAQECYIEQIQKWETEYRSPKNFRSLIADDIDLLLLQSQNTHELFKKLKEKGYLLKSGAHISIRHPDSQRFIRLKSLGEEYNVHALGNRIKHNLELENLIALRIKQADINTSPNFTTLQAMQFYTVTFKKGVIFPNKKIKSKPFCWKNDAELDKLFALNRLLRDGETLESMKEKFRKYENQIKECENAAKEKKTKFEYLYRGQQAFEFIYEGKHADTITSKEAMLYQEAHKNINAYNYVQIEGIVDDARKELAAAQENYNELKLKIQNLSGAISIYEKVHAGTYVQELVCENNVRQISDKLPNGAFSL